MSAVSRGGGGDSTVLYSLHAITSTPDAQLLGSRDSEALSLRAWCLDSEGHFWSTFVEFLLWTLTEALIVCASRSGLCKT